MTSHRRFPSNRRYAPAEALKTSLGSETRPCTLRCVSRASSPSAISRVSVSTLAAVEGDHGGAAVPSRVSLRRRPPRQGARVEGRTRPWRRPRAGPPRGPVARRRARRCSSSRAVSGIPWARPAATVGRRRPYGLEVPRGPCRSGSASTPRAMVPLGPASRRYGHLAAVLAHESHVGEVGAREGHVLWAQGQGTDVRSALDPKVPLALPTLRLHLLAAQGHEGDRLGSCDRGGSPSPHRAQPCPAPRRSGSAPGGRQCRRGARAWPRCRSRGRAAPPRTERPGAPPCPRPPGADCAGAGCRGRPLPGRALPPTARRGERACALRRRAWARGGAAGRASLLRARSPADVPRARSPRRASRAGRRRGRRSRARAPRGGGCRRDDSGWAELRGPPAGRRDGATPRQGRGAGRRPSLR